jgi:hypothetical protein
MSSRTTGVLSGAWPRERRRFGRDLFGCSLSMLFESADRARPCIPRVS